MGEGPASVCEGRGGEKEKEKRVTAPFSLSRGGGEGGRGSELMCYVKGLGKDFSGQVWTGTEGQHRVNTVKIFLLFLFSSLNNK